MPYPVARILKRLKKENLYRTLTAVQGLRGKHIRIKGKTLLNLASNDYLNLASDPSLIQAMQVAAIKYGAGTGASRLISGG